MAKKKAVKKTASAEPEVKRNMIECPNCGLERSDDPDDELYECVACGAEGYDCCVPGNNAICTDCEDERENSAANEETDEDE